jgi:hypothetical protein
MTGTPLQPEDRGNGVPEERDPAPRYVESVTPSGTVVLLVSGDVDRTWAAQFVLELSASWAAAGRRIVVADLHLERPLLGEASRDEDLEGIVDVFLYGASLSRIARPVRDGLFYLIPAGTYSPDAAEIFRHSRWKKVVAGFQDTGATLLLFVPGESAALAELGAWSSEAILLGSAVAGPATERLGAAGIEVIGVVGSPPLVVAESETEEVAAAAGGTAQRPGHDGEKSRAELTAPTTGRPHLLEDDLELPPPPPRQPASYRRSFLIGGGLLLVAIVLTTLYLRTALQPGQHSMADARSAGGNPTASRVGELLTYSVQVKAFTSLAAAREQLEIERRRLDSAPFFISPEEIQGVLYYRILAGLSADTVGAIRLRDELVEAGSIEAEDAIATYGLLQYTPLAYDLGTYPTREEAMARIDSLFVLQIPSYFAVMPYSDGSRRWHVYGGAYRDSAGAERMGELLAAAGLNGQLTVRAGEPLPLVE